MKKKLLLPFLAILCVSGTLHAQKGNNILQPSFQVSIPTNGLANTVDIGFGGAVKAMYGFSEIKQQLTLEAGYNNFKLKYLPSGLNADYTAIPVYAGYRYTTGHFAFEPQIGISINRIGVSYGGESANETQSNFAWAGGVSYRYNKVELGVKYQVSTVEDSDAITYLGIRLGYNFSL